MHSTKKGNQWYFGMKIHVGADVDSGAVHTVTTTAANVADITELPKLLREKDAVVFADAGYTSDSYKSEALKKWGYAGVSMTNVNPSITYLPARNTEIESNLLFVLVLNMCFVSSNNSLVSRKRGTVGWKRMPHKSIC